MNWCSALDGTNSNPGRMEATQSSPYGSSYSGSTGCPLSLQSWACVCWGCRGSGSPAPEILLPQEILSLPLEMYSFQLTASLILNLKGQCKLGWCPCLSFFCSSLLSLREQNQWVTHSTLYVCWAPRDDPEGGAGAHPARTPGELVRWGWEPRQRHSILDAPSANVCELNWSRGKLDQGPWLGWWMTVKDQRKKDGGRHRSIESFLGDKKNDI